MAKIFGYCISSVSEKRMGSRVSYCLLTPLPYEYSTDIIALNSVPKA